MSVFHVFNVTDGIESYKGVFADLQLEGAIEFAAGIAAEKRRTGTKGRIKQDGTTIIAITLAAAAGPGKPLYDLDEFSDKFPAGHTEQNSLNSPGQRRILAERIRRP